MAYGSTIQGRTMQTRAFLLRVAILTLFGLVLLGCGLCSCMPDVSLVTPTPMIVLVTATPVAPPSMTTPVPLLPTDTPTVSPTPTATPSPTHTPTPRPSHTPTVTPSDTPVPPSDTPSPTPIPLPPTDTPTPTPPAVDFVIVHQRMWTNEENGGVSPGGSVTGCGYGHQIYITVIDAAGNPLDGVVIGDTFNNPRHISGEKGPGHTEYDLYMNGYRLLVVEDASAGRPVTSQVSDVMSSNDWEIPIPWLIDAHYCASEEECLQRRADPNRESQNSLCWGHYSYEITFQRTW
jgi:hypothetical protein